MKSKILLPANHQIRRISRLFGSYTSYAHAHKCELPEIQIHVACNKQTTARLIDS